jgi:hypothetical protein
MSEGDVLSAWDEELSNWRERGIDRSMRGDGSDVVPPEAIASVGVSGNWIAVRLKNGGSFMLVKGVIRRPVVDRETVQRNLEARGVDLSSAFSDEWVNTAKSDTLRRMSRSGRDDLRKWFANEPHYADLIALIDRINAEEAAGG